MKKWNVIQNFTKEEIDLAVRNSDNLTDVLNHLGMNPNGKNRKILKEYCINNSIQYENLLSNHQTKSEYEKNPKLCKHCGKPIPWEKRENEYCCRSCSISEINKGKVRNPKGIGLLHKKLKQKSVQSVDKKTVLMSFVRNTVYINSMDL